MWMAIISFVGQEAAKQALKQFGGMGTDELMGLLFGKQDSEVNQYLEKLDRQMQEVAKSLREIEQRQKEIEQRQIFQDYNRADEELEYISRLYLGQADKSPDHPDRQSTCGYILDINRGVSERARRMIGSLLHKNLPDFKTFLEEYSDKLAEGYPDIYSYLDKIDAVFNHLRMNLMEAILLRDKAYAEIADKERVTDLALTPAEMKMVDQYYDELIGPVRELKDMFEALAKEDGPHVRLKHHHHRQYLTGDEQGEPNTNLQPSFINPRLIPQIYLSPRIQVHPPMSVVMDEAQHWKIIKVEEKEKSGARGGSGLPVRFMFQLMNGSKKVLDGTKNGRVYLGDRNDKYGHLWWQPIMSRNSGKIERGAFLLKHYETEHALDSDGSRVYAEDRPLAYDNIYMKWRLNQKNILESDGDLKRGEELLSPDGRYELSFTQDGELVLSDTQLSLPEYKPKVLWRSPEKGGVRCVMQTKDGQLVMYNGGDEAIWRTDRHASEFAGSKLILRNEGFFEIINKHNVSIYDTKGS
jgi:hypothetical protein